MDSIPHDGGCSPVAVLSIWLEFEWNICAVSPWLAKFIDLFLQPLVTADSRSLVDLRDKSELDLENPFGFFNLSRLASNIFGV